jgi:hypothetical protein
MGRCVSASIKAGKMAQITLARKIAPIALMILEERRKETTTVSEKVALLILQLIKAEGNYY